MDPFTLSQSDKAEKRFQGNNGMRERYNISRPRPDPAREKRRSRSPRSAGPWSNVTGKRLLRCKSRSTLTLRPRNQNKSFSSWSAFFYRACPPLTADVTNPRLQSHFQEAGQHVPFCTTGRLVFFSRRLPTICAVSFSRGMRSRFFPRKRAGKLRMPFRPRATGKINKFNLV